MENFPSNLTVNLIGAYTIKRIVYSLCALIICGGLFLLFDEIRLLLEGRSEEPVSVIGFSICSIISGIGLAKYFQNKIIYNVVLFIGLAVSSIGLLWIFDEIDMIIYGEPEDPIIGIGIGVVFFLVGAFITTKKMLTIVDG